MIMDHYSLEKLSQQRINDFQRDAAQRQLAREARGDEARGRHIPAWINVFALMALFARLIGLTVRNA
ncbi:MAG: hypothetical protein KJ065_21260 [Anaerolineae bacterium]|nr:hypothetical protein [Anaerolineae bacterium]